MDAPPLQVTTETLRERLDKEYGEGKPQDLYIDIFYLILGSELVKKREQIIAELRTNMNVWQILDTKWPEYLAGIVYRSHEQESEREREERLNKDIRIPLLKKFYPQTHPPRSAIIISRVCKYTDYVMPKNELTTGEIEKVLVNPLDQQHLDYFYLAVRAVDNEFPQVKAHLEQKLSKLPGEWKTVIPVTPQQTWPLTFIGYIPKKPFESEREREWRINTEVRMPLKQHLKAYINYLLKSNPEKNKVVIVLFSRACKYTEM